MSALLPDREELNATLSKTVDGIAASFGITIIDIGKLFQLENGLENVEADYNIPGVGVMHLRLLDYGYFVRAVELFRPFIQGFLFLLLAFYNINQFLGLAGAGPLSVAGGYGEYVRASGKGKASVGGKGYTGGGKK